MTRYILTRLSLFVPSLLLASLAIFVAMHVLPGDVALVVAGASSDSARIDPQQLAGIRAALGLNEPLPVQYIRWLGSLVDGQFGGASIMTHESTASIVQRTFPVTLELAVLASTIAWIVSIPVGVIAAFHRNRWPDYLIRVVTISGHSLPSFWLALLFLLAATLVFHWNPPIYYSSLWDDPGANLAKMIWPALILALAFTAYLARVTRSSLIEELNRDYVRTARGKGLSERSVGFKHALRNALIPVTTVGALQIGALLGGSVILETIFGLPGVGQEMVASATTRDYPVVQNLTLFLVLIALVLNLGVDVFYTVLDPRVRLGKR